MLNTELVIQNKAKCCFPTFEQLSQVNWLQWAQTAHCGIDAKWPRPLLTGANRLFFPISSGLSTSQADYFSASYTHSLQKQLLISAAEHRGVSQQAPFTGRRFRRPSWPPRRRTGAGSMASDKTRLQEGLQERHIRNAACPESFVDE
ncbi:hypothetical protein [Paraburkholderia silvatlantica]|uniref:Uncharacterized protein n=1 Tax=Paraburkholderia silvatlantica TaxID=321895 RepID=A0ABR6FNB0_9BURK|nr:hypothetical protein [Paraburkholderia silvatlantica]MBB2928921.1 hypothetical protein [Paraburkholderia silvatlantica]